MAETTKFVLDKLENIVGKGENAYYHIVGKGENANYQHFLFLLQFLRYSAFPGSLTLSQTLNFRLFQTERVCRR